MPILDIFAGMEEGFANHLRKSGSAKLASVTAIRAGRRLASSARLWNEDMRNPVPTLIDTEVDKKRGIARADVPLFFNRAWATTIAHGSDMVFPIAKVAEKLLEKGEEIVSMSGGFSQTVDRDIHITVWDTTGESPKNIDKITICGKGEFHTSAGRTFSYAFSMQKGGKITDIRGKNPLTEKLVRPTTSSQREGVMLLDREKLEVLAKDFANNRAFMTSVLYEMMTDASNYVFAKLRRDEGFDYSALLVRQIDNLPTNIDFSQAGDTPWLHGEIKKSRSAGDWTYLFVDLRFSFATEATTVCLAYKKKEKRNRL